MVLSTQKRINGIDAASMPFCSDYFTFAAKCFIAGLGVDEKANGRNRLEDTVCSRKTTTMKEK